MEIKIFLSHSFFFSSSFMLNVILINAILTISIKRLIIKRTTNILDYELLKFLYVVNWGSNFIFSVDINCYKLLIKLSTFIYIFIICVELRL